MKLRIKKHPKGYVAEIQKRTWYGRRYWTHYISVTGIPSEPWYYASYAHALQGIKLKIQWDITRASIGLGVIPTVLEPPLQHSQDKTVHQERAWLYFHLKEFQAIYNEGILKVDAYFKIPNDSITDYINSVHPPVKRINT